MPLVDPVTMGSKGGQDLTTEWLNKLAGKKLGDTSDETTFAKQDLPKEHRVINEGDFSTADFKPDRLNVHVASDGTVKNVTHG
ncbi:MAG: hypothetical protein M1820_006897 [Bogoriella megaspora]|nr:MAG: hypothetical protein M1820_006897 [Bogoriella megaspora]